MGCPIGRGPFPLWQRGNLAARESMREAQRTMSSSGVPFFRSLSGRMLLFGLLPTAIILVGIIVWLALAMYSALRAENEH